MHAKGSNYANTYKNISNTHIHYQKTMNNPKKQWENSRRKPIKTPNNVMNNCF